jgi:hypothetical protein
MEEEARKREQEYYTSEQAIGNDRRMCYCYKDMLFVTVVLHTRHGSAVVAGHICPD